jgi:hypothetical protein
MRSTRRAGHAPCLRPSWQYMACHCTLSSPYSSTNRPADFAHSRMSPSKVEFKVPAGNSEAEQLPRLSRCDRLDSSSASDPRLNLK